MKKLIAFVLLISFTAPLPVEAARLWSSGCEFQSDNPATPTDLLEFDTDQSGSTSFAIETAIKRSGESSCRATGGSGWALFLHNHSSASELGPFYYRIYFYIDTVPSTNSEFMTYYNGTDSEGHIALTPSLTLLVRDDNDAVIDTSDVVLRIGTWYRIEYKYDANGNTIEVRLDGTTILSGPCTGCDGTTDVGFGVDDFVDSPTGKYYFDDVAINDTTGSSQIVWPGPGRIVHLQPNAAGDTDNSTTTPNGWEQVDEVTPDDSTSVAWLATDVGGDILDVNLESSSSAGIDPNSNIILVAPGIREKVVSAASAGWQLGMKSQSGGTVAGGATKTHNDVTFKTNGDVNPSTPGNHPFVSYTDPQGGGIWTPSLLDSAQIRASTTDGNPDLGITTLWALVEYTIPNAKVALRNARINLSGGRIILRSTNQ